MSGADAGHERIRDVGPPSGTVTFLFTDIEGSTQLWEAAPDAMRAALAWHDSIVRNAIEAHGGYVFATGGDGFAAAFARAGDALAAAEKARTALASEEWPEAPIRVRMALHTGEAAERDGNYFGGAVNRAARLMGIGHGGQLLVSAATAELLTATELVDLGEHRLRDLDRPLRVLQVGGGSFGALRSLDAFPGNLPRQVTSFVGREQAVTAVVEALGQAPVVTLTGVGGVGKTRLALHAAAEALPRYRDGAWLCELAPVRDPSSVPDAVATVFDVSPRAGQAVQQALVGFLRGKELLLVLDNCEHLLAPVARLVDSLERSCPHLAVLATSREGLGIAGERMLAVPSLAAPDEGAGMETMASSDAVRLFVDRAQAVKASFVLTPANADAVAQVCRRLDGVPLAIELAAARIPAMNPAELARRLDRRFEVLAGGRRGAVERHQTLRAAIDWSYDLLDKPQRLLFARLSVFAGGCTLDAADAVCGGGPVDEHAVWEMMAALVAQSLVVAEDQGLDTRYRLLETIRQYAEERLEEHGETSERRNRHAQYYADLAAQLFEQFFGPGQLEAATRYAAEQENVGRAMASAIDTNNAGLAFQLLRSVPLPSAQLEFGFQLRAEPALSVPGAERHPDYPLGLAIAGSQAAFRGDRAAAERYCEEAIAAEQHLGKRADGLVDQAVAGVRGTAAMAVGSWHDAAVCFQHAGDVALSAGRLGQASSIFISAAQSHANGGDPDAALPLATEGLAIARDLAVPSLIGQGLSALANAVALRDPQRAQTLLRESLQFGDERLENAGQLTQATLVAARLRDIPLAVELAARAIPRLAWSGDRPMLAGLFNVVAWAAAASEPRGAAILQGVARRLALAPAHVGDASADDIAGGPSGGARPVGIISELRREATHRIADALGDARLDELRAEGERMDTDRAVSHALTLAEQALGRA
jgi:predicted ATPase/class 3 adenylate cyclase